jgi:copper chaperone CopZ
MNKTYKIEVDCAACALKCEEAISKLDFVESCQINFMTQKMIINGEDLEANEKKILKAARKVEPDFEILD